MAAAWPQVAASVEPSAAVESSVPETASGLGLRADAALAGVPTPVPVVRFAPPAAAIARAAERIEARRASSLATLPDSGVEGDEPLVAAPAKDVEQAFFSSGEVAETADALVPARLKLRWPAYAAAAIGALMLGVGFEALRHQSEPAPAAPPVTVVAAPTPRPAPAPAPAPAPVVEEAAPVVSVDVTESMNDARTSYAAGQYTKAISTLEQVVLDAPSNVEAWMLLGLARFDHGDSAGADAAAVEALKLAPRNPRAYILQASVLMDRGQREAAREKLQAALEVDPEGPFAAEARALLRR